MSDYLPQEVLIDILVKLPAVSLVRFRCVSKSWDSLITGPVIDTHLNYSQKNPLILLRNYLSNPKKELYSLHFDDVEFNFHSDLELPIESEGKCFNVVGSVNGVVCLVDNFFQFSRTVVFWNPYCGKCMKLPRPNVTCHMRGGLYMAAVGFGHDVASNDYKVIRIAFVRRQLRSTATRKCPIAVELYSHNEGSWRRVDANLEPFAMLYGRQNQVFLKGIVYWIAVREANGVDQSFVLSFDMGTESFGQVMLPESLAIVEIEKMTVSAFEEKLAIFMSGEAHFEVWVMEDHNPVVSWTKMYSFDKEGMLERALSFRLNGEILMETCSGNVVAFDPESKQIFRTGAMGAKGFSCAESYFDSLVLLREANGANSMESVSKKRKERLPDSVQVLELQEKLAAGTSRKEEEDHRDKVIKTEVTEEVRLHCNSILRDCSQCVNELKDTITGLRREIKSMKARLDSLYQAVSTLIGKKN